MSDDDIIFPPRAISDIKEEINSDVDRYSAYLKMLSYEYYSKEEIYNSEKLRLEDVLKTMKELEKKLFKKEFLDSFDKKRVYGIDVDILDFS